MLKLFNRKKKDNKGFTLVELVIVVAILAILVGILAPQYTKYVEKSRKAADVSNLENLVTAFKTAAADGSTNISAGTYAIEVTTTDSKAGKGVENETGPYTVTQNTDLETLLGSFAGTDWTKTKLKSAKWTATEGGSGALTAISAKIVVANDGSVNVSYYPTWIKQMSDQKTDGQIKSEGKAPATTGNGK